MAVILLPQRRAHRRIGLVLGAGGVLGAAWTAGALLALQDRLDIALGDADVLVGTSSGSVLAATLRCGVNPAEIVAHQRGGGLVALPGLEAMDRDSGSRPPLPRFGFGSARLLASTARAPHLVHPWVAASALLPPGRASHQSLSLLVDALLGQTGAATSWPDRPTWIVAVDYDVGRRVVFGRTGSPLASLPDAVVASCSIPGWYEPKTIGDRRYVDGGVRSGTSVGLLSKVALDDVYVLAPMASFEMDRPRHPAARAERIVRKWLTRALSAEIAKVTATGARVHTLTPGPDDLAAIGMNVMDHARRREVLETSLATSADRLAAVLRRTAA